MTSEQIRILADSDQQIQDILENGSKAPDDFLVDESIEHYKVKALVSFMQARHYLLKEITE